MKALTDKQKTPFGITLWLLAGCFSVAGEVFRGLLEARRGIVAARLEREAKRPQLTRRELNEIDYQERTEMDEEFYRHQEDEEWARRAAEDYS